MSMIQGYGIPTIGNNPNTNAPSGDRGWKTQGEWGSCSGTVVADRYFLAAKHVGGSVGNVFRIGGVNYTTISKIDHPTLDLTMWKVPKTTKFPTNLIANLCVSTNLIGKPVTIFGRGPLRGVPVARQCNPPTIKNFKTGNCDEFDVTGGSLATRFIVQYSTNLCDWSSLSSEHVLGEDGSNHIILPSSACSQMYYRTLIVDSTIGYELGEYTGQLTWGTNTIGGQYYYSDGSFSWFTTFDRNAGSDECSLAPGDSSGGMFVLDGGQWKLAGINWNSIHGLFYLDGHYFNGNMMDLNGVDWYGWVYPAAQQETPTMSNHTPIPVDWINSITGGH